MFGLTLMYLLTFGMLSGCGSTPALKERAVAPPAQLMQDCVIPARDIQKNSDLVYALMDARDTVALCNIEKAALRKWAESLKKE